MRLKSLDAKARSILYCGLDRQLNTTISVLANTAKEILGKVWKLPMRVLLRLRIPSIRLLEQRHHNFKMIPGESMNSLFSCFVDIANPLKLLGAEIPEEKSNLQDISLH